MLPALLALVAASLFTGAAVYITFAEHPARLKLDDAAALQQWKPSYERAVPMQAGLAILGGVLGFWEVYAEASALWLAGALMLFANVPFTLLVIMRTNRALKAIPSGPEPRIRALLLRWGKLHLIRSLLGAGSILLMAAAIFASHDDKMQPLYPEQDQGLIRTAAHHSVKELGATREDYAATTHG